MRRGLPIHFTEQNPRKKPGNKHVKVVGENNDISSVSLHDFFWVLLKRIMIHTIHELILCCKKLIHFYGSLAKISKMNLSRLLGVTTDSTLIHSSPGIVCVTIWTRCQTSHFERGERRHMEQNAAIAKPVNSNLGWESSFPVYVLLLIGCLLWGPVWWLGCNRNRKWAPST